MPTLPQPKIVNQLNVPAPQSSYIGQGLVNTGIQAAKTIGSGIKGFVDAYNYPQQQQGGFNIASNLPSNTASPVAQPVQAPTPTVKNVASPGSAPQYNAASITTPTTNLQAPGSLASSFTKQDYGTGAGSSVSAPSNPLDIFNNPTSQKYLQSQVDTLSRLQSLQQQLAEASVPSGAELGVQNQINSLTNTINNTNPQQMLKDNPAYSNAGITENQLERETQQQTLPMTQALSNLVLSKSVLGQQRQITANQLGAESTGLTNTAQIAGQIRQLTQFGGVPPEIASMVLQRTLFPQYGVTQNALGQPIAYNQYNPAENYGIGGDIFGLGGGAGQGGNIGGTGGGLAAGAGQFLQPYLSQNQAGQTYINGDRVPDKFKTVAMAQAAQSGIPFLTTEEVGKIHNIDVTQQNLDQLGKEISGDPTTGQAGILSGGLYGRTVGAGLNTLKDWLQTDPNISAFKVYRDTAINTIQALAGGSGSGFRLNQSEINTATSNLPSLTDNVETAQKKLSLLQGFLGKWQNEILANNQGGNTSGTVSGTNADYYAYLKAIGQ